MLCVTKQMAPSAPFVFSDAECAPTGLTSGATVSVVVCTSARFRDGRRRCYGVRHLIPYGGEDPQVGEDGFQVAIVEVVVDGDRYRWRQKRATVMGYVAQPSWFTGR